MRQVRQAQAHDAGKGDKDRAFGDYTEAIKLDPRNAFAYASRGIAYLYSGAPAKALADLNQANELNPRDPYYVLWLDIVSRRNKIPSRLSQAMLKIDMTTWPAPVIRMFLGQMTPAAVFAAADSFDTGDKKARFCEANFYSGELALRNEARVEGIRLFRLSERDCPKSLTEWIAASAELKALGAAH